MKCRQCGQLVRQTWFRCPRCRFPVLGESAESETSTQPDLTTAPTRLWLFVAGAVAVLILGAGALMRSNLPPATVAAASGNSVIRPLVRTGPSRPDTATARSQEESDVHEAIDSLRAGGAAYAQGDMAGAVAEYEAAVEAQPENAEARNNLAQALVRLGRARDALPHLDAAVRIDPGVWTYRFNRGRVYGQLNRWQDAVREYQSASRLFPEDYATYYNMGLAFMRLQDYPQAVAALDQAVTMAPGEPSFLITLGTALVGAEARPRARATFERFLQLFPEDGEAPRVKLLLKAMTEAGQ